ncbi:hypothetical protein UFOVP413_28 [uncultured Caudovirales phage]|uniref:RimL Acetyltransferases, including N-acetylases of ribosomal proteins n=1 Tax=uncultured Caudovirales phage TaxID=2100421 RepID=A0A6J5M7G3_9CAUD|nr:hypothetical protein UFOVP413_28 [uncultured Caudovirales phage]
MSKAFVHYPGTHESIDFFLQCAQELLPDLSGWTHKNAYCIVVIYERAPIAYVVYSKVTDRNLEMSIVTTNAHWCNRKVLRHLFHYPFMTNKVARVTATCRASNQKVTSMLDRLGFCREGLLFDWYEKNEHAALYGMIKENCKWLRQSEVN